MHCYIQNYVIFLKNRKFNELLMSVKLTKHLYCDGWNENSPHRLIDLNAWFPIGPLWEGLGGLAGEGVSLRVTLRFQKATIGPVSFPHSASWLLSQL